MTAPLVTIANRGPFDADEIADVAAILSRVFERDESSRRRAAFIAKHLGPSIGLRFYVDSNGASLADDIPVSTDHRLCTEMVGEECGGQEDWTTWAADTFAGSASYLANFSDELQEWKWSVHTLPADVPGPETSRTARALALDCLAEFVHDACELVVADQMIADGLTEEALVEAACAEIGRAHV